MTKVQVTAKDTLHWQGEMAALVQLRYEELEGAELARSFDSETRQKMAKAGTALPDGSFPIANIGDLKNAIRAVGRADPSKRGRVRAHIRKRAKALGATNLIPDSWDGSD